MQAGNQHQRRDAKADQVSFEKDWAAYGKDQEGGWAMAEGSEDPTKAKSNSSVPLDDQVSAVAVAPCAAQAPEPSIAYSIGASVHWKNPSNLLILDWSSGSTSSPKKFIGAVDQPQSMRAL